MQRRAYDSNQINRFLYRLDYNSEYRALGYGNLWGNICNKGDTMKEWQYDALREEYKRNEISDCEVECYEDGSRVDDGNPEDKETFLEDWYQCSCGEKYNTEEEAVDCCFPRYHVDYEEKL